MELRSMKIAAVWWGTLVVLALVVSRESAIDRRLTMLSRNSAALTQRADALAKRGDELANEVSQWKQRAERVQNHPAQRPESRLALASKAAALASDILDFGTEESMTRPPTIISAAPGGEETMRRNSDETGRHDRTMVRTFLIRFGGRVNGLLRKARPYRLDTSRLQRHIATIDSSIVLRLIVTDLYDLADQLEPPVVQPPTPAPEPRIEPPLRSTSAGEE